MYLVSFSIQIFISELAVEIFTFHWKIAFIQQIYPLELGILYRNFIQFTLIDKNHEDIRSTGLIICL